MSNDLIKFKNERILQHKKEASKLYKKGYTLDEICRALKLDISSVLFLLRKCRLKKKKLYQIFEYQRDRLESRDIKLVLKKDEYYLEKFFPIASSSFFSKSYYLYWKERYKNSKEKQKNCKHEIRHIRCGICDKILGDASRIELIEHTIIDTKTDEIEEDIQEE